MPELVEVELERRAVAAVAGRRVRRVRVADPWLLRRGVAADRLRRAVEGRTILAARRRGKLLLVDLDGGGVLGLRFGMTGRLVIDGRRAVDELQYASNRLDPAWDRLVLELDGPVTVRLNDPRRLGAVELDPDEGALGPDALTVTVAELASALAHSAAPLKARLLDQHRLAGVGNLIADETLWRAGLDPARPAGSLTPAEVRRLHRHLRATIGLLLDRGGSHLGDLHPHRVRGGACPTDGTPLVRRTVGGRTTFSCPRHQPAAG